MQYRTMILTDGSQVTVQALTQGPGGVISYPYTRPTLYLKDVKSGRYSRVPQDCTEEDLPALEERIQRPGVVA
jgi:hypothetical protein